MDYKLLILAPSAGGKSTLMRYLRQKTDLVVVETDEEIMRANGGEWPTDDEYKNRVLVPQTTKAVISRDQVVFLMKDIPVELLRKARDNGFKIILLTHTLEQLIERNAKRMAEEGYPDASAWFAGQLERLQDLVDAGLIDERIDGNLPTSEIAVEVLKFTED